MNVELVEALASLTAEVATATVAAAKGERLDVDLDDAWRKVARLMREEDERAARQPAGGEATGTWVTGEATP